MTTPVRQRDRVAILNALRAGVVPGRGLEHLQVGRAAEVQALVGDIKHIRERGTAVRFVVGEYGSGKSFFLQVIRHAAQRAGCVTMGADLAQDARLYGTGGRVMSLYSSLISSTGTKSQPDGGAMGEVLERFCSECDDRARRERRDAETVLHNRLAPLKGFRGGYEFADVVVTYWLAARHGDETRREAVLRWLSGQYRTKGEARAAIGVNGVIGDSDLYPTLRLLAMFIREAGYAGLLVELDELAVLARLNKPTRDQNYEQILTMVNDLLAGRAEGLGILFAGTPGIRERPDARSRELRGTATAPVAERVRTARYA